MVQENKEILILKKKNRENSYQCEESFENGLIQKL